MIAKTVGTWTPAVSSGVISDVKTAGDAAFTLLIPLNLPGSTIGKQGAKLVSVDVWYKIGTADCDDFATVQLNKMTLAADGVALTGTNPAVTIDADHDTAAERKASDEHKMTVTLDTPVFIEDDEAYILECIVDPAATTIFTLYGAQVNYTLRM
jgi:hypothetical protein